MRYLLDMVAPVMWWGGSPLLGGKARHVLNQDEEQLFVSAVGVWEIANKNRIGRLPQLNGFADRFATMVRNSAFRLLDLTANQALRAGDLAGAHYDSFDRLLAGQALTEKMTVLANDPQITGFGCEVLW